MKKYRWVLTAVFAAFLVGTSGCGKKTETIPITTISQSTDDDDPKDNLAASGDSDEIPEYDVDLSKNLNSYIRNSGILRGFYSAWLGLQRRRHKGNPAGILLRGRKL